MSQNGPKTTSHMMSLTKHLQPPGPNQKMFFRVQTRRLADPFEPLNSSLAQTAEELGCWQSNWQLLVLGRFQSSNISYPGSQSVKETKTAFTGHLKDFCDKVTSSLQRWNTRPIYTVVLVSAVEGSLDVKRAQCNWTKTKTLGEQCVYMCFRTTGLGVLCCGR